MRLMLSVALVLLCVATSNAQDGSRDTSAVDASASSHHTLFPAAGPVARNSADQFARNADGLRSLNRELGVVEGTVENVCYKMRTYVVARDDNRSDAVRPVAYYTCLPGTKVAMKSAQIQLVSPE
jgi:hypothetical protein